LKKFLSITAIVFGTLIIAGQLSGSSVRASTVTCDEYPTEPWKCAPLNGTMDDYPYLQGANFGAEVVDPALTWDSLGEDSTYLVDQVTGVCHTQAYVRKAPNIGGKNWAKATGKAWCSYQGVNQARTWLMTVCLLRSANQFFGWQVQGCHPKSAVATTMTHKIYRSCNGSTPMYWKGATVSSSTFPYWTSTRQVVFSKAALLTCG
jgi:hypothetical protein